MDEVTTGGEIDATTVPVPLREASGAVQRRRTHKVLFDASLKEIFLSQQVGLREPIGSEGRETVVYAGVYHGEDVAVKVFTLAAEADDLSDAISAYGAFKVECEKTMILSHAHPNVLQVIEYGELEVPTDFPDELREFFPLGLVPFMITKKAPFGSLDRAIRLIHSLPGFSRLKLMTALTEATLGIRAAHEHQVAHRDIKPQNILIFGPEEGKIADFGIARWRSRIKADNAPMLTPRYSSPEQAFHALTGEREERVGIAGDIYSWAIMVYELITGRHPFDWAIKGIREQKKSRMAILKAIAANDRRGFVPTGDITFDTMIDSCIADYKLRFHDIQIANRVLRQLIDRMQQAL